MDMASSKPIFLCGEAQGEQEAKIGKSFVGTSGAELLRMLHEAAVITFTSADRDFMNRYYKTYDPWCLDAIWSLHPEVFRTNVFQQHPPANDLKHLCGPKATGIPGFPALIKSGYVRKELAYELDRLGDEILAADPNLIVCLGNSALWALAGRTGVTKLRGTTSVSTHTVSGYKLLTTYHPAAVCRQWELRPTTVADLSKINREKEFADVRRPACEVWIEPTIQDIETFISSYITNGCEILSVDIETSGNQVTCIGFAPRADLAIVIPIHDSRSKTGSYWATQELERQCWNLIRRVLEDATILKLFQNGLYDVAFIWRSTGIKVLGCAEDSMLLHHALQPESLKGLGYLGSIYCDFGPWKSDHRESTIKRDA
jgi:uracil-DNA glycosylase